MLIRLLVWAFVIYLAYRVINVLVFGVSPKPKQNRVKGKPKSAPLDLSKMNVEDAKFEEINEKTKAGQ